MTTGKPTILVVGPGHLGGVILDFLAREPWIGRLVACGRSSQKGEARCNLTRVAAAAQGLTPQIEFRRTDIAEPPRFAELINSVAPQLILSTATTQTWWLPELLPPEPRARLQAARFGMWLPLHLAPTHNFMTGVRESSFRGPVLTAPFPDVVNCVLGRLDLAPTCGIGNVDEIVTKIRLLAAKQMDTSAGSIEVAMVAHHALESVAFGGNRENGPPYHLRVFHQGLDVTTEIDAKAILRAHYPLPEGPATAVFTAASTIRLVRAFFDDQQTRLHAPAPIGLPGGYPVLVASGQIDIAPIPDLDLKEAIVINERSHPFDGIQQIETDGTTVFMTDSVEIMRTELGYDCPRLAPSEAASRGTELSIRFKEYAARHGVALETLL